MPRPDEAPGRHPSEAERSRQPEAPGGFRGSGRSAPYTLSVLSFESPRSPKGRGSQLRLPGAARGRHGPHRPGFPIFMAVTVAAGLLVWGIRVTQDPEQGSSENPFASVGQPDSAISPSPRGPFPDDIPIEHVVFIVKENRTFDNFFGRYPGADGATEGETIDGRTIPLKTAPDVHAHDIQHSFGAGLYSINGGQMNGFNTIKYGEDLSGYTQFREEGIPNYWAHADRFVLADAFFSSMYGPTFPEHLYTVAAQSYWIVDNKRTADHPGSYCDDPTEFTAHFREDLTPRQHRLIMKIEERNMGDHPELIFAIAKYWENIRTCVDIKALPHLLEKNDISWQYYA